MSLLAQHRCVLHAGREAAARCPSCRQFFCRECVTEHDGRILCAACLRRNSAPRTKPQRRLGGVLGPIALASGFVMSWVAFYLLGQILLKTPSEWHEGKAAEAFLTDTP